VSCSRTSRAFCLWDVVARPFTTCDFILTRIDVDVLLIVPTASECLRILLVEDHETGRHGLRLLIDRKSNMRVVDEASDGAEAIARGLHEIVRTASYAPLGPIPRALGSTSLSDTVWPPPHRVASGRRNNR
jgi:hypothetical protein